MQPFFLRAGVLAAAVVLAGCGGIEIQAQAQVRGSFERTLTVSGPVEVSLRTGAGDIRVTTGAANEVRIVGRISARDSADGQSAAARVRDLEANPPIVQNGQSIAIGHATGDDRLRNVSISYDVQVPADTRLTSRTGSGDQLIGRLTGPVDASTGSGDIQIERTGVVNVRTGSGDIRVDEVAGDVQAQTGSGDVEVRQSVAGAVRVRTGSGDVSLALPAEAAFTLDARTGSGAIESAHPLTLQGRLRRNHVQGSVRGGGVPVTITTGSGSIRIR